MDIEQFRKAGYQAIDTICDYYYSLRESKVPVVPPVQPGYLKSLLPASAPQSGEEFSSIAEDYQKFIVPGYTPWQHPSFFAYFPSGFSFEGLLGDIYSSGAANPGFNWTASPACTELEVIVMDWAAQMLGLSPEFYNSSGKGGGCIQNTASEAAIVAIVAARNSYQQAHPDVKLEELVIYTTTQTHSLGMKAGMILGLAVRAVVVKPEDNFALRGNTLRSALQEDIQAGKKPFIPIATVGTTSSGAIDNLKEIKEVGNFDASTMWVRDRKSLNEALDYTPTFLRTAQGDAGGRYIFFLVVKSIDNVAYLGTVIDFRNWHLGLGRRYRSVKLWFVLRGFGIEGFQAHVRKSINLNNKFVELVQTSPIFKLVTPPSFALSVFRIDPKPRRPDEDLVPDSSLNDINRLFFGRVTARSDILLTQTTLDGKFCVRLAVGSTTTQEHHIQHAFDLVSHEATLALEAWQREQAEANKHPWPATVLLALGSLSVAKVVYQALSVLLQTFVIPGTSLKQFGAKKGAWAVVTGATDGIGKEFAFQLAKSGFNVFLVARNTQLLESTASEIGTKYSVSTKTHSVDFAKTNEEGYNQLAAVFEGLDVGVLVNNVGKSHNMPAYLVDTPLEEMNDIVAINVNATLRVTYTILPGMVQRKRGLILNVGSFAGYVASPMLATYSGTKAFLSMFSDALGEEVKQHNIVVEHLNTYFVVSKLSKIRKSSMLIPQPGPYVHSVLSKIGLPCGAAHSGRPYTSTPYWSHALLNYLMTVLGGPTRFINYTHNLHKDIRIRALRKLERETKSQ
uniref:Very-long-chain 3-oxoacyl-CoA reductase n=1 Tax=Moniliophthora roreri TaxID=221103 RepID=A0A0W0EX79_MONRR